MCTASPKRLAVVSFCFLFKCKMIIFFNSFRGAGVWGGVSEESKLQNCLFLGGNFIEFFLLKHSQLLF